MLIQQGTNGKGGRTLKTKPASGLRGRQEPQAAERGCSAPYWHRGLCTVREGGCPRSLESHPSNPTPRQGPEWDTPQAPSPSHASGYGKRPRQLPAHEHPGDPGNAEVAADRACCKALYLENPIEGTLLFRKFHRTIGECGQIPNTLPSTLPPPPPPQPTPSSHLSH